MPTATGFGALLADRMPGPMRYDEKARAVCLRIADVCDVLLALGGLRPAMVPQENHVDAGLTAGLRGQA